MMHIAIADRRQHQAEFRAQARRLGGDSRGTEVIDFQRQVRAMLLHRAGGNNRDFAHRTASLTSGQVNSSNW